MRYLTIIPARGGSKGLPRKNVLPIMGKPLIAWSIEHSLSSVHVDRTIVSTDNKEIKTVANNFGAETPFTRPAALSGDNASTEEAVIHCLEWLAAHENYIPDAVILLQCTSPYRMDRSIDRAIEQFEGSKVDSLLGVTEFNHFLWQIPNGVATALYDFNNRPRRQDIARENFKFKENGSIYITKTNIYHQNRNRLGGKIGLFEMTEQESLEIDTESDFKILTSIMTSAPTRSKLKT